MKRKVLVLASTFPRWKNDTLPPFIYELSRRLTKEFDVSVLAPHYPKAKTYEVMEGLKVYRFRYFLERYEKLACSGGILPLLKKCRLYYFLVPFFLLGEFLALMKLTKKLKPNIIHAHWIIPQGFIAALNKKINKIDYILTTHGGDIFGLQGKILTTIKNFTLKKASRITVVSNAIKKEILTKLNSKLDISVIPMGVDSVLFNPSKRDNSIKENYHINGPFLLFVGRLTEKKGVKYLIEAMPKIIKNFPKTKLIIIGNGELEQKLKELTNRLNLEENIFFIGAIQNKELPKYYATADIFIGPSIISRGGDTEGFGLTFVEAGMSGCWLIGSDIGGISDIIEDGKNGFLTKEKNSEDISNKIIKSIKLRHKFNNSRKILVNKFDWKVISEKYRGILK